VSAQAAAASTSKDSNKSRRARPSVEVARHQANGSCGAGSDNDMVAIIRAVG
jgi:hypothetical protein